MKTQYWIAILICAVLLSVCITLTVGPSALPTISGLDIPDTQYRLTYVRDFIEGKPSLMHDTFYFDEYEIIHKHVLFIKNNGNEAPNTYIPATKITSPYYMYSELDGWRYMKKPIILVGDFVLENLKESK